MLKRIVLALLALLAFACGSAGESVDSSDEELGAGVYVSKTTSYANAKYIGD